MLFFIIIMVIILYYCKCYKLDSVETFKDYTKSKNYQELDKPELYPYEQVEKYYEDRIKGLKKILKKLEPCDLIIRVDNLYCMVENIPNVEDKDDDMKCYKKLKDTDLVNKKYKEYFRKYSCKNFTQDQSILHKLDKEISWTKVQTELIDDIIKYRQLLLKTGKHLYELQNVHSIIDIKDLEEEQKDMDIQKLLIRAERIGENGSCFTKDSQIIQSVFFEKDCVKPYEWSNRCTSDKDCSFVNKNYENKFGSCNNNGYCGIPLGIKQKGYNTDKSVIKDIDKAECYNCVKKFETNCCKEQLDNKKMKSPDYAYKYDRTTRLMDNMNLTKKDLKVSTIFLH